MPAAGWTKQSPVRAELNFSSTGLLPLQLRRWHLSSPSTNAAERLPLFLNGNSDTWTESLGHCRARKDRIITNGEQAMLLGTISSAEWWLSTRLRRLMSRPAGACYLGDSGEFGGLDAGRAAGGSATLSVVLRAKPTPALLFHSLQGPAVSETNPLHPCPPVMSGSAAFEWMKNLCRRSV